MQYAPIVLFVYNRLEKTQKLIESLLKNKEFAFSDFYIFSDGAKQDWEKVNELRQWIREQNFEKVCHRFLLIERSCNWGLSRSVIAGISEIIKEYGKVIVLEDDLELSSQFLKYMNQALNFFEKDLTYGSVAGYTLPVKEVEECKSDIYATRKGDCWGWGTWKNRWECVDWEVHNYSDYLKNRRMRIKFENLQSGIDGMLNLQMKGEIDSWAVRWVYHLLICEQITIYPKYSLVKNCGHDESGTHCQKTNMFDVDLYEGDIMLRFVNVSKKIERANARFGANIWIRVRRKVKILLGL